MADLIDAALAKEMLGCDDATLNGYINNGSIRAQSVGGKRMLMKEDVDKFAQDDGTIVITGDSQDLQIDLGKVAGDAAMGGKKEGTQSITFGDDLEVVSFDDTGTKDLKYGKGGNAAPAKPSRSPSSFTDSNTEVMSAVDDSQSPEQTDSTRATNQSDRGASASSANASARRSVRSSRSYVEAPKVAHIWPVLMLVSASIVAGAVIPYYFIAKMPRGTGETKDYAGNVLRGVDDNFLTNLASSPAGFSVEPDKARYAQMHNKDMSGYVAIESVDPSATWRIQKYLGKHTEPGHKLKSLTIVKVELDDSQNPTQAVNALGEVYKVVAEKKSTAAGDVTQYKVDFSGEPVGTSAVPEAAPAPAP